MSMHISIYIYIHAYIYECTTHGCPQTQTAARTGTMFPYFAQCIYIDQTAPSTSAEPSTFKRLSCQHGSNVCMMLSNTSAALASQSDLDLFFDSISKLGRCSPRPSALTCRVARECSRGQELRSWPTWKCGPSHGPWACGWIKLSRFDKIAPTKFGRGSENGAHCLQRCVPHPLEARRLICKEPSAQLQCTRLPPCTNQEEDPRSGPAHLPNPKRILSDLLLHGLWPTGHSEMCWRLAIPGWHESNWTNKLCHDSPQPKCATWMSAALAAHRPCHPCTFRWPMPSKMPWMSYQRQGGRHGIDRKRRSPPPAQEQKVFDSMGKAGSMESGHAL